MLTKRTFNGARTLAVVLLIAIIATLAGGSATGAAQTPERITALGHSDCGQQPHASDIFGNEANQETEWLFHEDLQADIIALGDVLRERGETIFGAYIDWKSRTYIIVVDPSVSTSEAVAPIAASAIDRTSTINIGIEVGCASLLELRKTQDYVMDSSTRSRWDIVNISTDIDVTQGAVVVTLESGDEPFAEHLERVFGLAVVVEVGEPAADLVGGRANDRSPHYGGARIRAVGSGGCTSGFAADLPGGPRQMITAAHCTNATNQRVNNEQGSLYGTVRGRTTHTTDAARIYGNTYHRYIYVGSNTTRMINKKMSNLQLGTAVCLSGSRQGNTCNSISVINNGTGQSCTAWGCKVGIWHVRASSNAVIVRSGDSGGPAYGRPDGASTPYAQARGMIVNGSNRASEGQFRVAGLHSIVDTEAVLGVRIATRATLEW